MSAGVAAPAAVQPRQAAGGLETLHPAYFALVMATGIVSTACHLLGLPGVALVLLGLNVVFYGTLCGLYVVRLVRFRVAVMRDLTDHARAVGFFTLVAGTCVLGAQLVLVVHLPLVASALWILAALLYFVLLYSIFVALMTKHPKPAFERAINGTWLVAVVATQGVSLLGGSVWNQFQGFEREVLFFTLALWLGGGMLYVWLSSLIFYRSIFLELSPAEISPPYWIDMGAMAISTLAGAVLIGNAAHDPLLADLLPFLKGFTLFFWATASWWIPMLVLLGYWRHVIHKFPLRYDPGYWGMVFPLGMYTVATFELAGRIGTPFLLIVPRLFVWVALTAWIVVFCGMLHTLSRSLRG